MNHGSQSGKDIQRPKLVILGTSLLGPEVLDLIEDTALYEVTAFIENRNRDKVDKNLCGRPVIWIDDTAKLVSTHRAVCALGTTERKAYIQRAGQLGFSFASIIHPSANISSTAMVGTGAIISRGVIVASNTKIGNHVIINRGCLIGHDTVIQDCVTISPGANIAGVVTIGEGVYVGMGAVLLDRVEIGYGSVIGAGAVVTKDVQPRVQVMGIPARIVKENIEGK